MKRLAHSTAAFSLVEITLALAVASIFLIAVFGLLPVGVQTNQRSTSQTDATAIMSNVIADMRATPASSSTSPLYVINLTAGSTTTKLFRDTLQLTSLNNARYLLYVWIPPNPAGPNAATFAYLRVSWPPSVDPTITRPGGLSEMFAAFSRN
jgi:type II secretory pathway pseudopilin PulG